MVYPAGKDETHGIFIFFFGAQPLGLIDFDVFPFFFWADLMGLSSVSFFEGRTHIWHTMLVHPQNHHK